MTTTPGLLDTHDGVIAYDVTGPVSGPLMVCLPGMGDIRSAYRLVVPRLVAEGWRVAVMDLPGHGDSAAGAAPSQVRIGDHAAQLVKELGGPAIVAGHSFTPDSTLVAAQETDLVRGVVCLAPWANTPRMTTPVRALTSLVARSPLLWGLFYSSLHKAPPADQREHVTRIRASLRRRGGTATLQRMAVGEGKDATERRAATSCPVVVVMGDRDPDFKDPRAEAEAFAAPCRGRVVMAAGAGHYPHAEAPDIVVDAVRAVALQGGVSPDA